MTEERAIHDLVAQYADAAGRLDHDAAAATYAQEGVLSAFSVPEIVGRARIAAALEQTFAPLAFLSHQHSGGLVRVEGDRATARWTVQEWFATKGEAGLGACFGSYDDRLIRDGDRWRFARRRFHPLWRGRVPAKGRCYAAPSCELPPR